MAVAGGIGAALGGAASLGELGLGIFGAASGPSASNVQLPGQILGAQGAANNAYSGIGNLGQYNLYQPNLGQASGIAQSMVNNPYTGGYQAGANQAGAMGQQAGLNSYGAGGNLYGAGSQVLNTAFDPQNALYARTLQQLQDQVNAQNAMSGVASSPYGAGLANQAYSNFNIDWQNQQLGREIAGLGAAGGAYGQGSNLQNQGVGQYLQGSALPYGTFNTIGQNQLGALGAAGQFGAAGQGVAQQPIQDYLGYVGAASGNNIGAGQLGLNQAQLGWGQMGQTGQAIGSGLGGLGGLGWGTGPWSPYQMGAYDPSTMGPISAGGLVNP